MSAISQAPETNEPLEVPKVPKKRGRKRKSEIALQKVEEFIETVPQVETISRRGRPRKKVNYYELANPDNVEYPTHLESQLAYTLGEEEPKIKKKKGNQTDPEVSVTNDDSQNQKSDSDLGEISNGNHEDSKPEVSNGIEDTSSSKEADISLDDATTNLSGTTSTPNNKDKRYSYTGETVKMMNTLFTLFTDEKGAPESVNSSSTPANSNTNGKRTYRKTKKLNASDEDLGDGSGNVSCAVCNTTLDKSLWSHHKQKYHNNLAWRVGDTPLDLNDQSFVMHTLNTLYKKKKPLYCDKCGAVKKSVVGFLSHRSQCLKSEEQLESVKIACEICGRKMLPVSMSTHMKMLHTNPPEKPISEKSSDEISIYKPISSKRSAAKKAMRIIETVTKNDNKEKYFTGNLDLGAQQFALELMQKELAETQFFECKFKCNCIATSVEDALKHMEECTEKPSEGFLCKKCLLVAETLQEMISHVEVVHETTLENDDDDDPSFVEKENSRLPSFLYRIAARSAPVLFPQAFEWTQKFCLDNFSEVLFTDLPCSSNWFLFSPDRAVKYLPKLNESCQVAYTKITSFMNVLETDYSYKRYNLYDSEIVDTKITLFCGGPISSLAWLPTPHLKDTENQILAVCVLNSPDEQYLTSGNTQGSSAIQFWNFGPLKNREFSLEEPKLAFSLAHDHGPVWHMEWCPSGCYGEGRMGLLAVTGSDSVVYIYSIPFFDPEKMGLFYEAKPVMKLLLQRPESPLLGGLKYFPSKISWSKASGHQHVCVGYSNGFVALFNLKNSSCMLKFEDVDSIPCVLPIRCFQAHSHAITALALYHLNGGCRWLLSGSFDRMVTIWDLDNCNYPISSIKKNIVTDGFWLTNWLCYATAYDEGSTTNHVTTLLKQVRDYLYDPSSALNCSNSTISAISGSDWLNGVIQVNTVGEILAVFPHQLLQFSEQQRVLKKKRMLFGYTQLLEKGKTPAQRVDTDVLKKKTLQNLSTKKVSAGVKLSNIKSDLDCDSIFVNEPILYQEAEQKYALLFCDNSMKSYSDFPKTTNKQLSAFSKAYGVTQPNQYPLSSINKIVFNPNRQASLYYATGYQAGFVRISWMEFLKGDHQVK